MVLGPGLNSPRIRAAIPAELLPGNPSLNLPEGNALIELARDIWISGRRDDPWSLEPNYLRKSAAEEKWESEKSSVQSQRIDEHRWFYNTEHPHTEHCILNILNSER